RLDCCGNESIGCPVSRSPQEAGCCPRPVDRRGCGWWEAAIALLPRRGDTHMTKLSHLHYVLLAIAAKRSNGSILPPSASIGVNRAGLTRAINMLIKRGLADEPDAADESSVWRT